MNHAEDQAADSTGQVAALQERLSLLSAASLRINESLDFDTVLQGALDAARSLTSARYGVMTLLDEQGGVEHFLSSGLTTDEAQLLWLTPDGQRLLEALTNISEPLRVPDLVEHIRGLGFADFTLPVPVEVFRFMAVPIVLRDVRVGHVFVGDREDGAEFTQADQEVVMMFAAQAALVIANARQHREEQRARSNLETLINTSPVGVVVFDAPTGVLLSVNREAMRIVDGLRAEGQSAEDLLGLVTCVRSDGRQVSLRELPLAQALSDGETVRAEEITLQAPHGPGVSVLLNATPIRWDDGELASFVVTLQDMTPLEEQERLRADFLATVSHELRVPLSSIKGSAAAALGSPVELDPGTVRQFFRIIDDQADHMNDLVTALLDMASIEAGTLRVTPEPAEVATLVERAHHDFVSAGGQHRLSLDLEPGLPLVAADRRRIGQVLVTLLSNAARHSPETSVVTVSATQENVYVALSVTHAGRGIPAESLPYLFRKFAGDQSSAQSLNQGGDTGLGLAICKGIVEAHGGRIRAENDRLGLGASFTFTLPTVAGVGSVLPVAGRVEPAPEHGPIPVLVVDDDPQALRYVHDALVRSGYAPVCTGDPEEALHFMRERRPRLALLELAMPSIDAVGLMQSILAMADVPVILMSAYGRDDIVTRAPELGAADYIVKPYSPTELAARIGSALRRQENPDPLAPYVLGELTIDYAEHRVTLAGEPVSLVPLEYRLLAELSAHAGQVLTYQHLLTRVWRNRNKGDIRPVRSIINKLRQKLGEDAENPTYIFTEPRIGYRMAVGETAEDG